MQMNKLNLKMKKSDSDNCHQCHIQGLSVAGLRLLKANLSHEYQLEKAVTANHQYLIFTEAVQTVRTSFVCVICQDVRNGFVSDCKLTNKGKQATQIIVISVTETTKKLLCNAPSASRRITHIPCFWVIFGEIQ